MKASELRIGNLIYWNIPQKENVPHTVVGIRNDKPQTVPISLGKSIDDYKPIPLTEERLLLFGVVLFHNSTGTFGKNGWTISDTNGDFKKDTGDIIKDGYWRLFIAEKPAHLLPKLQYVHQLQNLYFALTGEELELKE
jgi:hypothetical protein